MKYLVILGDGMADKPVPQLGGKTPLQAANKPSMDFLAANGEMGLVKTVPDGMYAGSDVANLSVLGYNPKEYYTGRSPIEAESMGISLTETDVAIRCNLVTLSDEAEYSEKTMVDYAAGEISTDEARVLLEAIQKEAANLPGGGEISFHTGLSYRHCTLWQNGKIDLHLTGPHNIADKIVGEYLPENELLLELMQKSYDIFKDHPINKQRIEKGLRPANSIWFWGEGTKLSIPSFKEKFGLEGAVISAVDLPKGLGICAGLRVVNVPGFTDEVDTNYEGVVKAAVDAFKTGDFVYLHVQAPDECGHRGEAENKTRSIEMIDQKVLAPMLKELEQFGEFKIMLLPDHFTPIETRNHTGDAVPFVIYERSAKGNAAANATATYDEAQSAKTGLIIEDGYTLMSRFL